MKTFTAYLNESKQSWKFYIKTIHELSDVQSDRIEKHLMKYDSTGLGAAKKSILQAQPKDFPNHRGYEVYMYEFTTNLPVSSYQVQNEIRNMLGLSDGVFKVRGEHEIDEDIQEDKDAESLLADEDYSEADKVKGEDYYGEKYNTSFVKELLKLRKDKEKDNE